MPSVDFSKIGKSHQLVDDRGRLKRFPSRHDYVNSLIDQGLATDDADFQRQQDLVKAVYLDWLKRGQVGCVFAQLFGRLRNRKGLRTEVILTIREQSPGEIASEIEALVNDSLGSAGIDAISVLLPGIRDVEVLTHLLVSLSALEKWELELETPWRNTMVMVGLRRYFSEDIWAEILGLGPFQFLPPTRQSPITSLELRTSPERALKSKTNRSMRAVHLAQLLTDDFLTPDQHGVRFKKWTPGWKARILGGARDYRAKAKVTFTLPAAIWNAFRTGIPEPR